jgi:predicted metal-dependent hydrolase
MNHGGEFWKLVAEIFPNYKSLRKKLKNIKFSAEGACLSGGNRS